MLIHLRFAIIAAIAAVVLLPVVATAAVFANYEATYDGRVYPGVSALGVDLSGHTRAEASDLLSERAAEIASRPIVLSAAGQEWEYSAADLGLELDVDFLVEQAMAVGREDSVMARAWYLWRLRQEGDSLDTIRTQINGEAGQRALAEIAATIERPTIEAALEVSPDLEVLVTRAQVGRSLDQAESLHRLEQALGQGDSRAELLVVETPPAVQDQHVAVAAEQARNLLAEPLTVYYQERTWNLSRSELADLLRLDRGPDGTVEAVLGRGPLRELADAIAIQIEQTPIDARFEWAGGRLEVLRPSRPGLTLDPEAAVEAMVVTALSASRLLELPVRVIQPAVPMEDRHNLGINELIEQSTTSFAGGVVDRRHNVRLATERLNGVVVPPGGTFSFNESVGPTTLESGFRWGYGILGGADGPRTVPAVAGGICQVSTTLFQSVFWAGYMVEERYPHLYWIPTYMSKGIEGIETTVAEEYGLDFRFTNPTEHHLLIRAWVDNADRLHFALYGTRPDWTVTVEGPLKTNIRPADRTPVEQAEPTMPYGQRVAVEAARDGFDVRVVRTVTWGDESRTLDLISRYESSRNVTLVGTLGRPDPTPTPVEEQEPAPEATPAVDEAAPAPADGDPASDGADPAAGDAGTDSAPAEATPTPAATPEPQEPAPTPEPPPPTPTPEP